MSVVLSNIGQLDFYQKMFIKVEKDIIDVILKRQGTRKGYRGDGSANVCFSDE